MTTDDPDFTSINDDMSSVLALHHRAGKEYEPIVEQLIRDGCRDAHTIETILDRLLDFCDHASVLALYRKLCRHYYDIDPVATAEYVYAYRERWDSPDSSSE